LVYRPLTLIRILHIHAIFPVHALHALLPIHGIHMSTCLMCGFIHNKMTPTHEALLTHMHTHTHARARTHTHTHTHTTHTYTHTKGDKNA
jgi:hypothetical protein